MQLAGTSILTELRASGGLPSPTGVALTILELSRDPHTSTEDLTTVLQGDPSLTGKILKFANRASSGSRHEVSHINDALVRLGMSMVRQLCLSFSVLSNARSGPCVQFDYQRFWMHSLAMAVSCQSLSKRIRSVSPEEGFTCGLLGGIGRLALASVYPKPYADILETWDSSGPEDLVQLEKQALSIDHNQVTAALLEDWGLPECYGTAVNTFETHDWDNDTELSTTKNRGKILGHVLNISALAADICLETGVERHPLVLKFMAIGQRFGFDDESWMSMYDEIMEEWARMGAVLNILTVNMSSMEDLVKRARTCDRPLKDKPRPETKAEEVSEDEDTTVSGAMNILVATRDGLESHVLQKKLTKDGHSLNIANNGHDALTRALEINPDIILTDWVLDELDGLELARTLRQSDKTGQAHIIVMTSNTTDDNQVEALEAGANECINKPINFKLLTARLHAAKRVIDLQDQAASDKELIRDQVSQLGLLNRTLEKAAMEDLLTELPNRRAGLDRMEQDWARCERNDEPLLCMIMDIDHFKKVNDTYGHDAGDVVLKDTARVLKDTMRESDIVCRFGGEEFLVVCPGADLDVAKTLGDRIRKRVEDNVIDCPEFKGHITISIGIAVRSGQDSPKDLIKEADEALYAAKEAGRNKICIAYDV